MYLMYIFFRSALMADSITILKKQPSLNISSMMASRPLSAFWNSSLNQFLEPVFSLRDCHQSNAAIILVSSRQFTVFVQRKGSRFFDLYSFFFWAGQDRFFTYLLFFFLRGCGEGGSLECAWVLSFSQISLFLQLAEAAGKEGSCYSSRQSSSISSQQMSSFLPLALLELLQSLAVFLA